MENGLNKTAITLIATFIGFLCSLAYNFGYFWEYSVGISLLSLTDILKSYSLWIPSVLALSLGYGFHILCTRVENGKSEDEIAGNAKYPKLVKLFRKFSSDTLIVIVVFIAFSWFILFGRPYDPIMMGVACFLIWGWFCIYILSCKKLVENSNRLILEIFLIVPLFLIPMFFIGLNASDHNNHIYKPNATLYDIESQTVGRKIIILRQLENGFLVLNQGNMTCSLYPWDSVYKIDIEKDNRRFRGIICEIFNTTCNSYLCKGFSIVC